MTIGSFGGRKGDGRRREAGVNGSEHETGREDAREIGGKRKLLPV